MDACQDRSVANAVQFQTKVIIDLHARASASRSRPSRSPACRRDQGLVDEMGSEIVKKARALLLFFPPAGLDLRPISIEASLVIIDFSRGFRLRSGVSRSGSRRPSAGSGRRSTRAPRRRRRRSAPPPRGTSSPAACPRRRASRRPARPASARGASRWARPPRSNRSRCLGTTRPARRRAARPERRGWSRPPPTPAAARPGSAARGRRCPRARGRSARP